jgi:hypothetical protein
VNYLIGKIKNRSDVWNVPEVAVVKVESSVLVGEKVDWHHELRRWISTHLQGKVVENCHSGLRVKFNAESKAESVSKLRDEKAFRAAKSAEEIVRQALYLDSVDAKDTVRSKAYHYFAAPVEVDGKIYAAWFNLREPVAKDAVADGVFYELGVDLQNEMTHSPQRSKGLNLLASMNGSRVKTKFFLEFVKGAIAAHIPPKPEGVL